MLYRQRGYALEVHVPNRARLLVTSDEAILVAEARALDLGGIVTWGAEHLNWATRCMLGIGCDGIHDAARAGWALIELPLCADFTGAVLRLEDAQRKRWVGVKANTHLDAHPGDDDELATLYIGGNRAALYVRAYLKSRELEQRSLDDSTLHERLREGGRVGDEAVLWLEVVYREEGLALRPRGSQTHDGLGFADPAILADVEALARLWAHAFGHPDQPQSGRYRLLVEEGGAVDPRWLAVQQAAAAAPLESLAQVRERRAVERRARREQAERRWVKAVGEVARFDGFEPTSDAGEVLEHMAARTQAIERGEVREALVRADALNGDLFEPEGRNPPSLRELAEALDVSGTTAVGYHLDHLRAKG